MITGSSSLGKALGCDEKIEGNLSAEIKWEGLTAWDCCIPLQPLTPSIRAAPISQNPRTNLITAADHTCHDPVRQEQNHFALVFYKTAFTKQSFCDAVPGVPKEKRRSQTAPHEKRESEELLQLRSALPHFLSCPKTRTVGMTSSAKRRILAKT